MPEAIAPQSAKQDAISRREFDAKTSVRVAWSAAIRRWRLVGAVFAGSLVLCLIYNLVAPNRYEARAQVALRIGPETALNLSGENGSSSAIGSLGLAQLETIANAFRSSELASKVISSEKLAQSRAIPGTWGGGLQQVLRPDSRSETQSQILERFSRSLYVRTLPRTLIVEIRFRSFDPQLSAEVVNALIQEYNTDETKHRIEATNVAMERLEHQLTEFRSNTDRKDRQLADFQRKNGLLFAPETLSNGESTAVQHTSQLLEVDQLTRELADASSERIRRDTAYRAAVEGDPELVLNSDDHVQNEGDELSLAAFRQIRARRNELLQERARLNEEHGPNFPRIVEIRNELYQLDLQLKEEKDRLREKLRRALQTAEDRENILRKTLADRTRDGQKLSQAASEYEAIRRDAESSRALYTRVEQNMNEARLSAGVNGASIWIVDMARPPDKPISPNLPVSFAITLLVDLAFLWVFFTFLDSKRTELLVSALAAITLIASAQAQAPTPSTSGLPTGVARFPQTPDNRLLPNPKDAPAGWKGTTGKEQASSPPENLRPATAMPVAIAPGDQLDVSEFHTPEFHSIVRVSAQGTVRLPLIDEINLSGMSETEAAHAIAQSLLEKGMLTHPQVFVQVTAVAGMDVTVLGEVLRPGVYPLTVHHQLLDLLSAASGLNPSAGAFVTICHRSDPDHPLRVLLDPSGTDHGSDHNPEIQVGDTIQVSRAGVVYVVGDVIRPGGFIVDPSENLTVVQAISLAWGPSQNAALQKALLIRERKGGRTVTTLNLKRMLRGLDPDQPVQARDILFVPNSTAKNLINRSMESVVQSAAGVGIYAGLVYSQRF